MKTFIPFLIGILSFGQAYAQCGAPIVTSWDATDPENVVIHFDAPPGATDYVLSIHGEYAIISDEAPSSLTVQNSVTPGENTVQLDVAALQTTSIPIERYYFSAHLMAICANGDSSATNKFYFSSHSMRNDPSLNFGELFQPMVLIPDIYLDSTEIQFFIPAGDVPEQIEELSLFIDIGHTYIGDLSIYLTSPQGITTTLKAFPGNHLNSQWGLSLIYRDDALPFSSLDSPKGFCRPHDSLAVYQGLDPAGTWKIHIVDNWALDDGRLFGVGLVVNASPCEIELSGEAYYDFNANGIREPEEPALSIPKVFNDIDGTVTLGGSTGQYFDCAIPGEGFLSLVNAPNYYTTPDIPISVSSGDALDNLDFPLTSTLEVKDLYVDVFNITPNRPGFTSVYGVQFGNQGTECVQDVIVSAEFEPYMNLVEVDADGALIEGQEVVMHLDELCPQETGLLSVEVLTHDTVTIGTLSTATAAIEPVAGDETPDDNVAVSTSVVVGSYDPNDKAVEPEVMDLNFVNGNKPLEYLVRFQNTGTYYAERVLVVDTLDALLDPLSLTVTAHSHPMEVSRSQNVFYFTFDDIYLPDSTTDEVGSNGFVRFEVTPYPGLTEGAEIENEVAIFFDFNPPIFTNTALSLVDFTIGIQEVLVEPAIYPNPTTGNLRINLPGGLTISEVGIYNMLGQRVKHLDGNGHTEIDVSVADLKPGTYLIQINSETAIRPVRFVKW